MFRLGGGRFSPVDPGNGHPIHGSKALIYGTWDRERGTACTVIARAPEDGACTVRVIDQIPESGLMDWAALMADPECRLVKTELS